MVAANYTRSRELIEKESFVVDEGKMDICRAIKELILDGKMEGIVEGKAEGKAESILMLVERYGTISDELKREIKSISDEDVLGQLLILSASAKSVEEFEQRMKELYLAV